MEDKHIEFVAQYYESNKLDTPKALDKFMRERGIRRPMRNPLLRWSAVAASAAALLLLGRVVFAPQSQMVNLSADGATLIAYLPDSTVVTLADGSTLRYDAESFGEDCRHVDMSGEVFFDVTRNEQSSFEVFANSAKVEVLGTQFLVDESGVETELFVESGRVRFSAMDDSSSQVLTKGMAAELDGDNIVSLVEPATANPAAWATGKFVYENTPLSDVLSELSSFYDVTLSTADASQSLTATFAIDNLDAILSIIESVLEVEIERR